MSVANSPIRTVAGAAITPRNAAAVMTLGFISLLSQGVLPLLLGTLHSAHRISYAGIGVAACLEALAVTLSSALAGSLMTATRLRSYALASLVALMLVNVLTGGASGDFPVEMLRLLAGIPEGLLFWIAVGLIARASNGERWAAVLVSGSTILALLSSAALTLGLMTVGPGTGFQLLAFMSGLGTLVVGLIPDSYSPLVRDSGSSGPPTWRAWAALLAALLYTAAGMGVFIYLVPLAEAARLPAGIAGTAVTALLAGQLAGSLAAVWVGARWNYSRVLLGAGLAYLTVWPVYALHVSAIVFVTASLVVGATTFFSIPYLYPLAVAADPTRRTAMLSGPAQMLGSAVGPLLAALAISADGAAGLLSLSVLLLALSAVLIVTVRRRAAAALGLATWVFVLFAVFISITR